jgi:hypothetical protein
MIRSNRLGKLRNKFGISARRVAIRTYVAWYWRGLEILAVVALVGVLVWWGYDMGQSLAGFDQSKASQELIKFKELSKKLQEEINLSKTRLTDMERQLQIGQTAQSFLATQVKTLQEENSQLKEDLTFLQKLMSADESKTNNLSIQRFKVERDALPGEFRYRLLLVQERQRGQEFRGNVQFVINLLENGKKKVLTLPSEAQTIPLAYQLNFKYYQRIEGSFQTSPQAQVKSVQVRVYETGGTQAKLLQTVNIS